MMMMIMVVASVILASCVTNSVSAYGALELRSEILQQKFLSIHISEILNNYVEVSDLTIIYHHDQTLNSLTLFQTVSCLIEKDPGFRYNWDNLQRQYFCCGTFNFNLGYADWKSVYSNNSVPDSCCHLPGPGCGANIFDGPIPPLKIYVHGCLTVIQSKLEQELTLVLVVFTVLQVNRRMSSSSTNISTR